MFSCVYYIFSEFTTIKLVPPIIYNILHTGVIKVNLNILRKDDMIEIVRGKVSTEV